MQPVSSLIGKPILSLQTGEPVGKVQDFLFDESSRRLLALVVKEGGLLGEAQLVPYPAIKAIGPDDIMVENKQAIVPASSDPALKKAAETGCFLKGKKVVTEAGSELGKLDDLCLDEQSGQLVSYLLSKGKEVEVDSHEIEVAKQALFVAPDQPVKDRPVQPSAAETVKQKAEQAKQQMAKLMGK